MVQNNIPTIVLCVIHNKLKKRVGRRKLFPKTLLKEIIKRKIIQKDQSEMKGGNVMMGIPKIYIYDVINDMVRFSLIKKIDLTTYELLDNQLCEYRLKKFPY